jgi:hypothetical protein
MPKGVFITNSMILSDYRLKKWFLDLNWHIFALFCLEMQKLHNSVDLCNEMTNYYLLSDASSSNSCRQSLQSGDCPGRFGQRG